MLVLAYINTADYHDEVFINFFKKCFLLRVRIEIYNIEIDGRNFYDQAINDSIKQYDENINRTRWWLHNWLFIRLFTADELITADLTKKKL